MKQSNGQSLSRRERQIMELLYQHGEQTARDIQEKLSDRPAYSTVRALLAVMVDKGHARFRQEGSRYVYFPVEELETARQSAVRRLLRIFFRGSTVNAFSALLGASDRQLSDTELDELSELIEREKAKRK